MHFIITLTVTFISRITECSHEVGITDNFLTALLLKTILSGGYFPLKYEKMRKLMPECISNLLGAPQQAMEWRFKPKLASRKRYWRKKRREGEMGENTTTFLMKLISDLPAWRVKFSIIPQEVRGESAVLQNLASILRI